MSAATEDDIYGYFLDCELRGVMHYMVGNELFDILDDGYTAGAKPVQDRLNQEIFNRMTLLDLLKMNSNFKGLTKAEKLMAAKIP